LDQCGMPPAAVIPAAPDAWGTQRNLRRRPSADKS
jgi:hypothetical protein